MVKEDLHSERMAGKARKRNPFRKRHHHDGGSEHGSDDGTAANEKQRNHHRKFQWSPRVGQKNRTAVQEAVVIGEDMENQSSLDEFDKNHPSNLHWSPGLGPLRKKQTTAGDGAAESVTVRTPNHVRDSPRPLMGNTEERKKCAAPQRHGGDVLVSGESISDGEKSDDDELTKKEKVAKRIHRIRRKLNRRSKNSHWRDRIGDQRIDEEEKDIRSDQELDALEGFYHYRNEHSLAGDLEMPERHTLPFDRWQASEGLGLADQSEVLLPRPPLALSDPHSSPRNLREGSYDELSLGHSHHGSSESVIYGSSSTIVVSDGKSSRKFKSENKEFRVKPFQCFGPDVVYMTEAELHSTMLQPSEKMEFLQSYIVPSSKQTQKLSICAETERLWGNTEDGRIGSLRVEVLSCIGLAPVKPDVAVYLICGDVPFMTDVLNSCRSPMWPPQSKRAALFPVHHAYARLFAGVFATKKDRNDDFCGRVVLDLASLRPNTEYDAALPLRASSFVYDRRPRGVIRLRFSLHWFSERAAVMSYLKSPHSLVATTCKNIPSVLCGDPKTFRNVAIVVYGQDLPGKYTHKAFRATMREFNLSRVNTLYLIRMLAIDAVMYEKPLLSLYLFISWMHCVYSVSVRLAPVYFVGYLIFHLFDNYEKYNKSEVCHLGYAPLTLQELLYSLVSPPKCENMHSIQVDKKAVKQNSNNRRGLSHAPSSSNVSDAVDEEGGDVKPIDHREFPFSEKFEYPMFRPVAAIVPATRKHSNSTSNQAATDMYIHSRLSIVTDSMKLHSLTTANGDNDEWDMSEHEELDPTDSEDIQGDVDSFMESDEDEEEEDVRSIPLVRTNSAVRRIPLGPPQSQDVEPLKKIPPQVILARAENTLHKLTFGLSMDKLIHSTLAVGRNTTQNQDCSSDEAQEASQSGKKSSRRKKRRRAQLDEYDKRLGLCTRPKNPVVGITASFLGPLMRIFRIYVVATRTVFNIGVWRDPFLSFWALCFLLALMAILIVFPWRSFLFLVGLVCFGPQNILVRGHLLRHQSAEDENERVLTENEEAPSNTVHAEGSCGDSDHSGSSPENTVSGENLQKDSPVQTNRSSVGPRRRLQNKLAQMKERRRIKKQDSSISLKKESLPLPPRPAFSTARHPKSSKVPLEPREVVVPYTRIRTERFYDWPPDPTVSRATPLGNQSTFFVEEVSIPAANKDTSPQNMRRRTYSTDSATAWLYRG